VEFLEHDVAIAKGTQSYNKMWLLQGDAHNDECNMKELQFWSLETSSLRLDWKVLPSSHSTNLEAVFVNFMFESRLPSNNNF
jgi:hypothetical protein